MEKAEEEHEESRNWGLKAWRLLSMVREQSPLIQCITNFVSMDLMANTLLSGGASPAMVHSLDEIPEFTPLAAALCVNAGTLTADWLLAMKSAAALATQLGKPWVFDPVAAGATSFRLKACLELVELKPTVIRGNGSEIIALCKASVGSNKGVDSLHDSTDAVESAKSLAKSSGSIVAVSGAVDIVTDGDRVFGAHNGVPMMQKITATGCSVTALIAAFVAVDPLHPFEATVIALSIFGLAGEIGMDIANGPASLRMHLIDSLYGLDEATVLNRAKITRLSLISKNVAEDAPISKDEIRFGQLNLQMGEANEVEIKLTDFEIVQWEAINMAIERKRKECSANRKRALRARYYYGVVFLITNLIAWSVRDYGQWLFSKLPYLSHLTACGNGGYDCFRTLGVLRVSLGCFIFFFVMFLTTCQTSKLDEARNTWHSQWWALKLVILLLALVVSFFIPSEFIQLYGEFARVGAGVFLIFQLISVIEFIAWWNSYWMPDEAKKQSSCLGLFMSTLFYIASMCGIVVMYVLYVPKSSCSLNIFFISWTVVLLLVMMSISLHSKVNRGLLSSGIMAFYIVYLCWSAIRSEPVNINCSLREHGNKHVDWTNVLGFLFAIAAVVIATFSTGIDSQTFQFRKDKVKMEDNVPYNYGFFHLIFSLGAMSFAMLFISWKLDSSTTRKWSIDVGWASTWVKIVNEWLAATIYLWKLISPIVRQEKVMHHQDSSQP